MVTGRGKISSVVQKKKKKKKKKKTKKKKKKKKTKNKKKKKKGGKNRAGGKEYKRVLLPKQLQRGNLNWFMHKHRSTSMTKSSASKSKVVKRVINTRSKTKTAVIDPNTLQNTINSAYS